MPCMFLVNEMNREADEDPRDTVYFSPVELWLGVVRGCLVSDPETEETVEYITDDRAQITMAGT
jgi:hypothetical protein